MRTGASIGFGNIHLAAPGMVVVMGKTQSVLVGHAFTQKEYREPFVSLRDNAKVSPFWYRGFHRSNGRGRDWVLPR